MRYHRTRHPVNEQPHGKAPGHLRAIFRTTNVQICNNTKKNKTFNEKSGFEQVSIALAGLEPTRDKNIYNIFFVYSCEIWNAKYVGCRYAYRNHALILLALH